MRKVSHLNWRELGVPRSELVIAHTCALGQSFSWRRLGTSGVFVSPSPFPVAVREWEGSPQFAPLTATETGEEEQEEQEELIKDYFQLQRPLGALYSDWSASCGRMSVVAACIPGVRVLRQDPFECLMSFICSSNNNVKRISLMLDRLRARYGLFLCSLRQDSSGDWAVYTDSEDSGDGSETDKRHEDSIRLYTFPTVVALATAQEEDLRALGVGYRARFITGSAGIAATKGPAWLLGLRQRQRLEVVDELLALPGVGRKVADCVALFSLDQSCAVPVDTHVWDIVVRDYDSSLSAAKSLTPTVYESVGDIFRQRFKSHAGWAHSVLFAAELPEFRALLPEHIVAEMLEFANQRRLQSAEKKAAQRSRLAEKISAAAVNADDPNDLLDMLTPDPSPTAKVSRKSKRQSPNDLL